MDLGFETIGNATVIIHDGGPVLATDPWIEGPAYFGSWTRSHAIPEEQRAAIEACPYLWISHGHPDHLSGDSLDRLRQATLLLPDHVGGRIRKDLVEQGYRTRVLPCREWVQLSPRVHVACIADWNQDAVLLINVGGRLVVDLNDAGERGWGPFVRGVVRRHPESYLLRLSGYGDADMINKFTEDGKRIPPAAAQRIAVGPAIARDTEGYGARFFIPFSSMHHYQRADSVWANEFTTPLEAYGERFESKRCELLPPFARVDLAHDAVTAIDPPREPERAIDPKEFGDDWQERLEAADVEAIGEYIRSVEHVRKTFGFVNFRVGGQDNRIALDGPRKERGFTFEVPRASLMTAVKYRVFDDLLIGNFMKVTLHGGTDLYPDFSPYVAKYGDNGGARTRGELEDYFKIYRDRDWLSFFRDQLDAKWVRPLQANTARIMRKTLGGNSAVFKVAKSAYYGVRRFTP
jgi:hypothetical protein